MTIIFAAPVDPEPFAALRRASASSTSTAPSSGSRHPSRRWTLSSSWPPATTIVDFLSEPADLEEIFLDLYREADHGS